VAGGGIEAVNGRRLGEFAPDSPLEGDGFEPSVPGAMDGNLSSPAMGVLQQVVRESCCRRSSERGRLVRPG
jgi:hypothetical protein